MIERIPFECYIDESGDEGLASRPWFILSAVVVRKDTEKMVRDYEAECKQKVWIDNGQIPPPFIHWRERKFSQRKAVSRILCEKPYTQIVVGIWKHRLDTYTGFGDRNILFRYASKLLLERVSWLVEGRNGCVNITFSNRGGFDLKELRNYISLIAGNYDSQIKPVFDPQKIKVLNSSRIIMLRMADNCTSSFGNAFNPDQYRELNPECANILQKNLYRYWNSGRLWGYGLKVFPSRITQAEFIETYPFTKEWF